MTNIYRINYTRQKRKAMKKTAREVLQTIGFLLELVAGLMADSINLTPFAAVSGIAFACLAGALLIGGGHD